MKTDFLGNRLEVGDIVLIKSTGFFDSFEFCEIVSFTEKNVLVERKNIKRARHKNKRIPAHQTIKVDRKYYTMYLLKKQGDKPV